MNISTFRRFEPFRVSDTRCILSSPEAWREPLEWQREAMRGVDTLAEWGEIRPPASVNVLVQPDPFTVLPERLHDIAGEEIWVSKYNGFRRRDEGEQDFAYDHRPLNQSDVLADLFALIDRTPLLTWWIPTRHPERVRERWPTVRSILGPTADCEDFGFVPATYKNVRLGMFADAMTDVKQLDSLHDLCGGCFILHPDGSLTVDLRTATGETPNA